jgi:ketosteroid isomerase-like protein
MKGPVRTIQSEGEAQIRELLADQVAAMRSKDAERLVSRYAPEIVQFTLAPPLRHTGAEVLDPSGVRSWLEGFEGPMDFEIRDLRVTVGEDVAFCHSLNRLSATPRGYVPAENERSAAAADGEWYAFDMWFRATVCLQKQDGTWKITHEHTSTPFYMDGSFKAATDLQP